LPLMCSFRFGDHWGQTLFQRAKHTGPVVTTSRLFQAGAQAFLFHPRIQTTSFSAPLAADFGKPWTREKHGDH